MTINRGFQRSRACERVSAYASLIIQKLWRKSFIHKCLLASIRADIMLSLRRQGKSGLVSDVKDPSDLQDRQTKSAQHYDMVGATVAASTLFQRRNSTTVSRVSRIITEKEGVPGRANSMEVIAWHV